MLRYAPAPSLAPIYLLAIISSSLFALLIFIYEYKIEIPSLEYDYYNESF
jgi:hypothetical protein